MPDVGTPNALASLYQPQTQNYLYDFLNMLRLMQMMQGPGNRGVSPFAMMAGDVVPFQIPNASGNRIVSPSSIPGIPMTRPMDFVPYERDIRDLIQRLLAANENIG